MRYEQVLVAISEVAVFKGGQFRLVDRRALRFEGPVYEDAWAQVTPLVYVASRLHPEMRLAWADDEKAAEILGLEEGWQEKISAAQDAEGDYDPQLRLELIQAAGLR